MNYLLEMGILSDGVAGVDARQVFLVAALLGVHLEGG